MLTGSFLRVDTSMMRYLVNESTVLDPEEQLDLILKDRAEHCHLIRYQMQISDVVLCDRFTASTIAYQGAGQGLDIYRLNIANEIVTEGLKPDWVS